MQHACDMQAAPMPHRCNVRATSMLHPCYMHAICNAMCMQCDVACIATLPFAAIGFAAFLQRCCCCRIVVAELLLQNCCCSIPVKELTSQHGRCRIGCLQHCFSEYLVFAALRLDQVPQNPSIRLRVLASHRRPPQCIGGP